MMRAVRGVRGSRCGEDEEQEQKRRKRRKEKGRKEGSGWVSIKRKGNRHSESRKETGQSVLRLSTMSVVPSC